jgi:putative DNA methylase
MLATSVVLVCRRRSAESPIGTTSEFVRQLRTELPEALRILQLENIAPVDLAQSSIGPGMAVFSSFSRVLKSDGQTMSVGEALTHINEILSEILSGEEGEMDAPTRFALTWFDQYGFADGPSHVADTLANAKNTSIERVCQSGIATSYAGKTRILKREDLSDNWDPISDKNLTTWEIAQHLIKNLEISENKAAQLLKKIGIGLASQARIVAYLLHEISVKNGLDREALAYNTLIVAWPELEKLARQELTGDSSPETLF